MKKCPECCSDMPDEAEVCHACGRRIIGKLCPQCAELSKAAATKCRYCGHDFARDEKIAGYHYHSGWFWDGIEIQTRGQKSNSIGCLPKPSGRRIKETLEQMKE
jgi:hypothetical protein